MKLIGSAAMGTIWLRILTGGVVWAAAYNAAWGLAWLGFMRHEWEKAAALSGSAMPWTHDFWVIWVALTIPFGVAISAYLNGDARRPRLLGASVAASLVMWVPGTIGMAFSMALTTRVILLDSAVNLVTVFLATTSVAWLVTRHEQLQLSR